MKYNVLMHIEGYHRPHIEAKSKFEATTKALELFEDADYGCIEDIDVEISNVICAGDEFTVSMRVTGTHNVTVEAENEVEASREAAKIFGYTDYGSLYDIECEIDTPVEAELL